MFDAYIAHGIKESGIMQSVSEHNANVAFWAAKNCSLPDLQDLAWLAGIFHDAGKYQDAYQDYLKKALAGEAVVRGSVDHSTGGGQLVAKLLPGSVLAEMLQLAIYCHHGLADSFSLEDGKPLISHRLVKSQEGKMVAERFYQFCDKKSLQEHLAKAGQALQKIMVEINSFSKSRNQVEGGTEKQVSYGNRDFFLGMYQRLLLSLLIDGDRTDTAAFMQEKSGQAQGVAENLATEPRAKIWEECLNFFEKALGEMPVATRLDADRQAISLKCKLAAAEPNKIYRLTVPTGAGKTLSSLRFALHHAQKFGKERIFYIAPYNSILEQNAQVIRGVVGKPEIVLEHHCNVIQENFDFLGMSDQKAKQEAEKMAEARAKYELLAENWDSPIVVTTAVQFLNTLFLDKTTSVRRLHNLCNSIIIFDEIQALPIRIMKLFNLAVNFLANFCNTTVVLCSATQPLLDKFSENRMLPPQEMAGDLGQYASVFRRTSIIDKTSLTSGGFDLEEFCNFVLATQKAEKQVLVIVNTQACAANLYQALKQKMAEQPRLFGGECKLFHLSNRMCAKNRQGVLAAVKSFLPQEQPLICVTTALIEAGVDISFNSVIRSLVGLDSVVQAAGRCNRSGNQAMGKVYLVRVSKGVENVASLPDIVKSQGVMATVLNQFAAKPAAFENSLDSQAAINFYYELYFNQRMAEMDYPVSLKKGQSTLVELLSGNQQQWHSLNMQASKSGPILKQAFKTAGEQFKVILEAGKVDVVVPYTLEAAAWVDELANPYLPTWTKKEVLRNLQKYTVRVSVHLLQSLNNAIFKLCDGTVLVLDKAYYSQETGVEAAPVAMENLFT